MSVTEGLRVGDTVVHSRTMEVKFAKDGYVELHDTVEPTIRIGLHDTHKGSDVIKIVKKAKPKVGDIITGVELKETPWKRGTVIQSQQNESNIYMLNRHGEWSCSDGRTVGFNVGTSYKFKVLHVA